MSLPKGWSYEDEQPSSDLPEGWKFADTHDDGVIPELRRPQRGPMEIAAAAQKERDREAGLPEGWKFAPGAIEGTLGSARRGLASAQQTGNLLGAVVQGKTAADWLADAEAADAKAEELETTKPLLPLKFTEEKQKQYAKEFRARAEHSRQMAAEAAKGVPEKIARVGQLDREIASIPQAQGKEDFDRAQGVGETLRAVGRHPIESIAGIAAESLPASAPSLALGAVGSLAGGPGAAAGAGIGSFATEFGSKMLDELRAEGVDFDKPETVEAVFKDRTKMARIRDKAVARGVPVALFDALSAGVAGKLVTAPGKTAAQRVGRVMSELAVQGGLGGAGEAAGSVAAGDKVNFKDVLAEVLGEVGGGAHEIAMGAVREKAHGASDTGKNVPESRETLREQQKAVLEGRQAVQMFPEGTAELPLPKGLDRVETERGVFHFDPERIRADEIEQLSNAGRENEFLGLGPASKEEIDQRAKSGEPVSALVEKTPGGAEVKGAVVVPSTEEATRREMEARMDADNQLVKQSTNQTILERLRAQEAEQARAQEESRRREIQAREERARASLESQSAAPREAADTSIMPADSVLSSQTQPGEAQTKPVTERSGEQTVPAPVRKGKRIQLPSRADGVVDVLDALNEIGGIAGPSENAGGEYDGFREAFGKGTARLLVRREAGAVDQKIQELHELGFSFESPDALYSAVSAAVKDRARVRETVLQEKDQQRLYEALYDNKGRNAAQKAKSPINSDELTVGDKFKARGEAFVVTDVNPDSNAVTVRDGPRFGTQVLPGGTPIYPDNRSLKKVNTKADSGAVFEDRAEYQAKRKNSQVAEPEARRRAVDADREILKLANGDEGRQYELSLSGNARSDSDGRGGARPDQGADQHPKGGGHPLENFAERGAEIRAELAEKGRVSGIVPELVRGEIPVIKWEGLQIKSAHDFAVLAATIRNPYQERFGVAVLDESGRIILARVLTAGSLTASIVDVKGVSRAIEQAGPMAKSYMVWHNHPSGNPAPSMADRSITSRLREVPLPHGVKQGDHIITNGDHFYSFAQEAVLPFQKRQNAEWEMAHREKLTKVTPDNAAYLAGLVRPANEGRMLAVYLTTKNTIAAVELIDARDTSPASMDRALQQLVVGAGREGANGVIVEHPGMGLQVAQKLKRDLDRGMVEMVDAFRGSQSVITGTLSEESPMPGMGIVSESKRSRERRAEMPKEIPKIDRRDSLMMEYKRGVDMQRRGENTGNLIAEHWGERMQKQAKAQLDREFPGWNGQDPVKTEVSPEVANAQPAQPEDGEASPFSGEGETPAPNRGRALEVYGHSAWRPSFLEKTWEGTKKLLSGFKGALPDLPTFGDAWWNKADPFIKENGGQFYNRLRQGIRRLRISNDHIQNEAANQVEAIVKPLQKIGSEFSADDYAKLQRRQAQARKFKAEKKPLPKGAQVELEALNAKLESSPYVLFEKLVLMLDMQWRYEHLKDSAGNPIVLPMGINDTEVKAELKRLGQLVEISPNRDAIAQAIEAHMALVRKVGDDLKERGLMSEEELSNPYYFPHLTLQKTVGGETTERQLEPARVSVDTAADFRGYLIDPVGSRKPIETDYVKAMYYHLVQVGAHNLRDDVAQQDFRHYDVMKDVQARAAKLSKERGAPVSWEQAFHEEFADDGYVMYGAGTGDLYSGAKIDRNKLAQQLAIPLSSEDVRAQLKQLGLQGVKILPEDIRAALESGERETWILPARVAESLRRVIAEGDRKDSAIETALKKVNGLWKGWKLFMPWNHIRYEYGNIVADMEKLFSADPTAFKFVPQSAKEVAAFFSGKSKGSPDLKAAIREGVINSITAQEMSQLPALKAFEEFQTTREKVTRETVSRLTSLLLQPITVPLGLGNLSSVQISALREAVTRYAKFKADLERLRNGARPAYAGAYWKDVEAIKDSRAGANDANERKAAEISLKTFGDYGDVSVNGRWLREKMIPFYSWIEVNFKYHANLFRNLKDMVTVGELSKAQAARSAGIAVAGTGARAAAGVLLRLAVPYVAVAMWNAGTGLEDELSDEDRRRFHIILGKGDDGKVQVVYAPTAFLDVIKWFSGPEFMRQAGDWMRGRTDLGTAVASWAQHVPGDLANNTLGQMGPAAKIPYTLASGKNPFPDVTDQRTIPAYDMKRVILGQMTDDFTADQVMRVIDKDYLAPKDAGDWAKQLILQVRQRDPEQWAFYSIKDKANDFVAQKTGKKRETDYDAPDQQVLRNFRKSIYRGDTENAVRFYERLVEFGYTAERFKASIQAQDPLAGVPKALRKEFVDGLSEFDREQLKRAYAFYTRMTEQRNSERALFPMERIPENYRLRWKPRTERLLEEMGDRSRAGDDEIARRAKQEMERSLRPASR